MKKIIIAILWILILASTESGYASPSATQPVRHVHVPYWASGAPYPSRSIFWMGKVDPDHNYADIRMVFDDQVLKIEAHVIDRLLWYDPSGNIANIDQWDSVSIFLNKNGNTGTGPTSSSYKFEVELLNNLHAVYRGNGTSWVSTNIPFTAYTEWRGVNGPNSAADDKGWVAYFEIPFASLGLSAHPPLDMSWGLGVILHDRDAFSGPVLPNITWPETMNPANPSSWGILSFGWAHYDAPRAIPKGSVVIRGGVNQTVVTDADVGGHTTCGDAYGPDYWSGWGDANYAGLSQISIQNQWDISDWPCFSKFFITFPTNSIPPGKTIISATYTMYLLGNAGGGSYGSPPDSYIQAFTVDSSWSETNLTWNDAPMALENLSGTWVSPLQTSDWVTYRWDVSSAVAQAYASGQPVRLAFYSADGDYHTGKYFASTDWSETQGRPFIQVVYGNVCDPITNPCKENYIPYLTR